MGKVLTLAALLAALVYLLRRATEGIVPGDVSTDNTTGEDYASGGIQNDFMDKLRKWAETITHFEGGNPGDRNMRNNNPGNLKYTGQPGTVGKDKDGFAVFSSPAAGMDALVADLSAKVRKYPDYSLLQIMTRYLGGDVNNPQVTGEGNPFAYAATVARALGVAVTDKLSEVFG